MINLKTNYLGLQLKNPIIVSSSGLTSTVEKIKQLEKAGAGAVVLKSLFEEQIKMEAGLLLNSSGNTDYPEASDYINSYVQSNSLADYLTLIEEAKNAVEIPVIASINCYSGDEWTDFAKKIEAAGADALELNIYYLPTDKDFTSHDYERIYFDLSVKMKNLLHIPFAVKLGAHFTNLTNIADQLYYRGATGVVLFNRFYSPDIDLKNNKFKSSEVFSSPSDIRNTLRWVAIVSAQIEGLDISASTGVHSGEAVIKLLLAGAKTVQVCSVLYKKGADYISTMIEDLKKWMEHNNYSTIDEFRGTMSYKNIPDPSVYERAQFMKYFSELQ